LIQRQWLTYDPVKDAKSPFVACNNPGSAAPLTATAKAGSTVNACFNNPWAHNTGPLTVYMTECPGDCSKYNDLSNAIWFPVYKEGKTSTGKWATQAYMNDNSNCIPHKIPSTLKPGNYLIRHETIVGSSVTFS
jgi:lytic cellulose monooxygenase (C1-hydroxylating)